MVNVAPQHPWALEKRLESPQSSPNHACRWFFLSGRGPAGLGVAGLRRFAKKLKRRFPSRDRFFFFFPPPMDQPAAGKKNPGKTAQLKTKTAQNVKAPGQNSQGRGGRLKTKTLIFSPRSQSAPPVPWALRPLVALGPPPGGNNPPRGPPRLTQNITRVPYLAKTADNWQKRNPKFKRGHVFVGVKHVPAPIDPVFFFFSMAEARIDFPFQARVWFSIPSHVRTTLFYSLAFPRFANAKEKPFPCVPGGRRGSTIHQQVIGPQGKKKTAKKEKGPSRPFFGKSASNR